MKRRISSEVMCILLSINILALAVYSQPSKAEPKIPLDPSYALSSRSVKAGLQSEWETENMGVARPVVPRELDFAGHENFQPFDLCINEFGELIVGVNVSKPQIQELEEMISNEGGNVTDTISIGENVQALTVEVPTDYAYIFAEKLRANEMVRYVEPNSKVEMSYTPNDPYWSSQWGPKKIQADVAWDTTTGSSHVLVAISDTGIDYTHTDLAANYVPLGYDWVNDDMDPMDDNGHGSHCAGIVAAELNNGVGIAGLAQVRIMAEKVLCNAGWGYDSWIAKGIYHAVAVGARIISMSLGGHSASQVVYDAVKHAYDHGVLVIAAAGNDGADIKSYPAAYNEVVAVSATDSLDNLAEFSSYGSWVELSAPGVGIYSTVLGNSYAYKSGTSMATPHVSGVAALVWSIFTNFTNGQIRQILKRTADDLGDFGFDEYYGYGRVNARKANIGIPEHDMSITGWQYPHRINPGQLGIFNVTISNYGGSNETSISVQFFVNKTLVDFEEIDFLEIGASDLSSFSWDTTILGNYNCTCYIVPPPGETVTENNIVSSIVHVRFPAILKVPEDYPTIKQAVNNAYDGDTILIVEGHYAEGQIDILENNITLIADGSVILDGQESEYVLNIKANHVFIEGFEIRNASSYVINMKGYGNTVTKNDVNSNKIKTDDIRLYESWNSTVSLNNVTKPPNWYQYQTYGSCIMLERSSNCTINSNTLTGGALFLQHSQSNFLASNNVTNGNFGLVIANSPYNTLRNNIMSNNSRNFCVLRHDLNQHLILKNLSQAINDIDTSNTVNGKPIYYWIGVHDRMVPLDAGCVVLVYCKNIKVEHLDLRNNLDGILLLDSNGTMISQNDIAANTGSPWEYECGGITTLFGSSNNIITLNKMTSNEASIWVTSGSNYTVSLNNITNSYCGLFVNAKNSIVSWNKITDNWNAVYVYGSNSIVTLNNVTGTDNSGVRIMGSNTVVSANNLLAGNTGLELDYATNCTVVSNNIVDTRAWPMRLFGASGNRIFHNNIINHGWPVRIQWFSANTWDDGYPSGGNYWSNYTGIDVKSGPSQDLPGSDGIGDTAYVMDTDNIDNYPLMNPYWLPGDVNHDFKIDIYDVVMITGIYRSEQGDPNWNYSCDIAEPYGIINIYDVVTCTKDYGKEYTP
jgi:thermitase